jgi:hypothetical protein
MLTGGFELGSSALTSSTLKWLHRIQCGFNSQKIMNSPLPILLFRQHQQQQMSTAIKALATISPICQFTEKTNKNSE